MAAVWADDPAGDAFDQVGSAFDGDLRTLADDADACAASTALAQPAIMAASLAAFDALAAADVHPDVVAGHSLGEVTAATAAGVLDRASGARLVTERGRAMGEACAASPGTMAAVLRLDVDVVAELVDRVPDAAVANNNAPGQVVVAGPPPAVQQVVELAEEAGGRVRMLDVEGAFHSAAMAPAVAPVRDVLEAADLHDPGPTFLSGLDGGERSRGRDVADSLVEGILAPVRWVDVQHALVAHDVDLLVECGPGGILAGCAKRTIRDVTCLGVASPADVTAVVEHLAHEHSPA
ncbi:ACP S-malonyltransferase [Salsipaludibacter albus]|uniref:ACP S-malonyltransferase n=1 Tax=Salsipaludibacter albus TaxID=2849650 RepID=UPI001EE4AA26|nr:ACP S-malonyltransferase [Salsipaludibacter albus]MBY5164204.1 ACP S-malonyltransferase [Salsipaludibacter albus]